MSVRCTVISHLRRTPRRAEITQPAGRHCLAGVDKRPSSASDRLDSKAGTERVSDPCSTGTGTASGLLDELADASRLMTATGGGTSRQ